LTACRRSRNRALRNVLGLLKQSPLSSADGGNNGVRIFFSTAEHAQSPSKIPRCARVADLSCPAKMTRTKNRREEFGNRVPLSERVLAVAVVVAYDVLLSDRAVFVERRRLFQRFWSDEPLTVAILDGCERLLDSRRLDSGVSGRTDIRAGSLRPALQRALLRAASSGDAGSDCAHCVGWSLYRVSTDMASITEKKPNPEGCVARSRNMSTWPENGSRPHWRGVGGGVTSHVISDSGARRRSRWNFTQCHVICDFVTGEVSGGA